MERGLSCVAKVNAAFAEAGLRAPSAAKPKPGRGVNLNTLATLSSGALALTLECSVSYDRPKDPTRAYSFDELMEPNFILLRVMLRDGLERPFVDRSDF